MHEAIEDWLASLTDKTAKTVQTQKEILDPLDAVIGKTVLRELEADDLIRGLQAIAKTRASRTVRDTRAALERVITFAQARNLVARNVASFVRSPPGTTPGRPSKEQAKQKADMESARLWQEHGLVFTTYKGTELDAANVRRSLKRICRKAKVGDDWAPRDLGPTFVSIMSESGVAIEEIARLVGHDGGSGVTERVYRKELRPVITTGAEVMDTIMAKRRRTVRRRTSSSGKAEARQHHLRGMRQCFTGPLGRALSGGKLGRELSASSPRRPLHRCR